MIVLYYALHFIVYYYTFTLQDRLLLLFEYISREICISDMLLHPFPKTFLYKTRPGALMVQEARHISCSMTRCNNLAWSLGIGSKTVCGVH